MKNKKKIAKIIIPVIAGISLLGGITTYMVLNGNIETSFVESSNKEGKDESGIDWSKYKVYDIKLAGSNVKITKAGVYNITGTLKNGTITVDTNDNVKLVLNNTNITSKNNPAIYVKKAKNTYIELKGKNKINSTTTNTLDAAIYSKDDLYLYGKGSIEINSNKDGISSKDDLYILSGNYTINSDGDGIKGKDSVTIIKGEYTITSKQDGIKTANEEKKGEILIEDASFKITANNDGITSSSNIVINGGKYKISSGTTKSEESQKGIKAVKTLTINNGDFTITSIDDTIHSNDSITINNGTFKLSSGDDGIHADNTVAIKKGTVSIEKSSEEIEAYKINLEGGDISVTASDDGINIGGGNDNSGSANGRKDGFDQDNGGLLTTSGGNIYVNADGDGLDSNGSIKMTGGVVHVDGPTNNGNGALDYNGEFTISGGELIAVGSSGMVQNVSNTSTQNTILINLDTQTSGDISLGNITYSPKKNYQSVLISSSSLELNKEYTLKTGSKQQSISLTNTVSSSGNTQAMGNGMNRGMPNGEMSEGGMQRGGMRGGQR